MFYEYFIIHYHMQHFPFPTIQQFNEEETSPWILWVKPKDILVHMQQRSVSLSHTVNARIILFKQNKKQKQTDAPSKVHKMWRNKNIVSGEEPDNVVDEEGDAWASPSLDAWVFLEYAGVNHRGIPKLRAFTLLDHIASYSSLDPWKLPPHQT